MTWDLEQNSFSWKITVAEVDDQETYTTQETVSSEFATNFSVNTQGGTDKVKVGLNFGMSTKAQNKPSSRESLIKTPMILEHWRLISPTQSS